MYINFFVCYGRTAGHGSYALVPGVSLWPTQSQPRYGCVRTVLLMFMRPFNPPKDKENRLSHRTSHSERPRAGGWTNRL